MTVGSERQVPPHAVLVVADDYGIAPGVGRAIRALIASGRLSGTGCMTLFAEWPAEASRLRELSNLARAAVGLHLTLTDFQPLCGRGPLGEPPLPSLSALVRSCWFGGIDLDALFAELDAQLEAFVASMGRLPDYIDGHQHVHFLPPVRRWLQSRANRLLASGTGPWLRGAPSVALAQGLRMRAKAGFVSSLAAGFDREMRRSGFTVKGPLAGFYDWRRPADFPGLLRLLANRGRDGMVVMCHPGELDDELRQRDRLVAARALEFAELSKFGDWSPLLPAR
jgi:predicted glycoside hydrolase/deacetylase ChbG (UPF0249 family)